MSLDEERRLRSHRARLQARREGAARELQRLTELDWDLAMLYARRMLDAADDAYYADRAPRITTVPDPHNLFTEPTDL